MEGNERIGTGQDTRERLESEIDEWCAEHFNSSFSGRAFNLILEWLDRQAEITERYWMHLCGCTTSAATEINKKLEVAEDENKRLRTESAELVRVLHELEQEAVHAYNCLQEDCETITGSETHFFEKWWHAECQNDKLKAENENLRKELETTKHKCDSLQFGMDDATIRRTNEKQENEALRKRLQDRIDSLQAENACLLYSINSLRNCLLRDWHIETEWSECLKAYLIRL